jgi:hypothetical protein
MLSEDNSLYGKSPVLFRRKWSSKSDGEIIKTVSKYAIIEPEKLNKPEGYPSFIMNIIKEGYTLHLLYS